MGRFTNAPLPSINLIKKSLLKRGRLRNDFLNPWRINDHLILPLSRSAWSLKLIAKYKIIQSNNSSLSILVPSYFCNSSLAPLREMKVSLVFYPIKKNGEPDIDEVSNILANEKIDIIIGVHFFGSRMNFTELSSIARKCNIWFVEDFAHLLNPPKVDKIKSDFQLFSPHKFLPIPDGALLSINKRIFETDTEESNFVELHKSLVLKERSYSKAYLWLLKRLLQKLNFGIKVGINDYYHDEQINNPRSFFKPGMTNLSQSLLSVLIEDLEQNKLSRQENAHAWKRLVLNRYPSAKVLFPEQAIESYYLIGFEFSDEEELKEALRWFDLKKFPVCTWPDLPQEILDNNYYFRQSIRLRNNSIFFQVHSSIDKKTIESFL